MSGLDDDGIEGLANRMAMLVSDDGEADNAGRAVGTLARKLGLSGGQLKAMFMAGAGGAAHVARAAAQAARIAELEAETETLRETLRKAEVAARALQRDRDSLRNEVEELGGIIDQRRTARQARLAIGVVTALAVVGGLWVVMYGPRIHLVAEERASNLSGSPFFRTAVIRDRASVMHKDPSSDSPALTTLTIGTHLVVHKTLWHDLQQWVEVELNGQTGYVLSTDVDLS